MEVGSQPHEARVAFYLARVRLEIVAGAKIKNMFRDRGNAGPWWGMVGYGGVWWGMLGHGGVWWGWRNTLVAPRVPVMLMVKGGAYTYA